MRGSIERHACKDLSRDVGAITEYNLRSMIVTLVCLHIACAMP